MRDTQVCRLCGAALSLHERTVGDVCSAASCRARAVLANRKAVRLAQEKRDDATARDFAEKSGAPHDVVARVPYFDRGIGPADPAHVARFKAKLRGSFREAVREPEPCGTRTPEKPAPQQLDATCIACRGHCCRLGTGHAFLDDWQVRAMLRGRPKDSPAAVYRDYVRRIPGRAYVGSCVYQGERGCVLPRGMRADICNTYECDGRERLRKDLSGNPDARVVVVAMLDGKVESSMQAAPEE